MRARVRVCGRKWPITSCTLASRGCVPPWVGARARPSCRARDRARRNDARSAAAAPYVCALRPPARVPRPRGQSARAHLLARVRTPNAPAYARAHSPHQHSHARMRLHAHGPPVYAHHYNITSLGPNTFKLYILPVWGPTHLQLNTSLYRYLPAPPKNCNKTMLCRWIIISSSNNSFIQPINTWTVLDVAMHIQMCTISPTGCTFQECRLT